jgi:FkbM family methyltransferase
MFALDMGVAVSTSGEGPLKVPLLASLAVPYARLELPGWGRVLKFAGVMKQDAAWKGAPTVTVRGKYHGYLMTLDLSNWSERRTYFLGRFYELSTQLFVKEFVRLGDSFIDVGGNIGMITLLAARRVGASGRVHAFEPNPAAYRRLKQVCEANGLAHVTARELGLGDQKCEMELTVLLGHTGMGTFGAIPEKDRDKVTSTYTVKVERGDDVVPPHLRGPATIKIDVEGFECHVLRGLRNTLQRLKPAVITEALTSNLRRAGSSLGELFGIMREHGYDAYDLDIQPYGLRYRLSLTPCEERDEQGCNNLAFIHPDSPHAHRYRAWRLRT